MRIRGYSPSDDWTVEKGALTLTETLRVGDDESYFFGSINDVAVRADQRIYVSDLESSHVKVLAPGGTLQDTIGRSGLGPGEFNRPADIHLARGDSVFVLDRDYRGNLSVFTPSHKYSYRISLRAEEGSFSGRPVGIVHISEESGYLVRFTSPPHPREGLRDYKVRRVRSDGTPGGMLFTYPPAQQYVENTARSLSIRQIPFSRNPAVRGGPEGSVHYAWSDSLKVQIYGTGGNLRRTVDIPFEPVPVTEADRDRKRSTGNEEWWAKIGDMIPATKPAFTQFLVDDEGRYWFGRPTATPDSTDWWVAWPNQKRVVTTTLPSEVELKTVKDGSAYGQTTTGNGGPVLVRYEVRITS